MCEGMVGTSSLIMWSRNNEMRSVGPLQPLTIYRSNPVGVLAELLEKVHALCSYLVR